VAQDAGTRPLCINLVVYFMSLVMNRSTASPCPVLLCGRIALCCYRLSVNTKRYAAFGGLNQHLPLGLRFRRFDPCSGKATIRSVRGLRRSNFLERGFRSFD
jgi:hypothetical protein